MLKILVKKQMAEIFRSYFYDSKKNKARSKGATTACFIFFGEYPIEDLQVPTLIFHAKDDNLASYAETERAVSRFPNCTFISFESGGHLLTGHGEEIKKAVSDFAGNSSR